MSDIRPADPADAIERAGQLGAGDEAAFLYRAARLAGVSVWRLDLRTQRIHFNAVGFLVMGMSADPAGIPLAQMRDTIHPDDLEAVVRAADEAIGSDRVIDVVARYRNTDGSWRTLLTRRAAERDASGRAVALAGVSLDLSEQEQERKRHATLQARSAMVAEAIGVGFWSFDEGSGRYEWDEQMFRVHRRDPALGVPDREHWVSELVHASDQARVRERIRQANERWERETELRFRLHDGPDGERWVQAWARRVVHQGRRLQFGMHLDVTERERLQGRQQRERERMQFAVDAAGVGVWEFDVPSQSWSWSAGMYRIRGFEPDDPRGPDALRRLCMGPDDVEAMARRLNAHVASGEPFRAEFRIRRADGALRWVVSEGRAVRGTDGRVHAVVGVNLDVTERRAAERLAQEKQRIEQASRDKSAFMARMSHELRTPLNAVLGFAGLLDSDRDEPPSARQRERLRRIADAGHHLLALVDDLLELARTEAEPAVRGPADAARWPVAPWLLEQIQLHQAEAQARGVRIEAALSETALALAVDGERLARALSLLLSQMLRRAARGAVLRVGLARHEGAGHAEALLSLCDDGRTSSDEQHLWLFESFAPDDSAAPSAAAGDSGLPMSLARALVGALGGRLETRAQPDSGDEIRLLLPLPGADAGAATADTALTLLCVEDSAVNLQLVRELVALRPAIRLHTATDAASGLASALTLRPDVILLDLRLPDQHGIELVRRLRQEEALAGRTIIALSADAMHDTVQAALAAGFDAYWTKPIQFDRFLAELDRLIAAPRPPR